jgi:hypothetical protein
MEQDLLSLSQGRVGHLTYIPSADLSEELIRSRFGEPTERITEKSGIVHWLYPGKGMDIAVNPNGKEVFQYVLPARFPALIAPLIGKDG